MKLIKNLFISLGCLVVMQPVGAQSAGAVVTLRQLLSSMQSNYELLKYNNSLVQSKQALKKAVYWDRIPHLNALYEATVASNDNLSGSYLTFGEIPTVTGTRRSYQDLSPISGQIGFGGIDWEAINFGGYHASENLAKAGLAVQSNELDKTQYDLYGISAFDYLELIRQYELTQIEIENVNRLQELKVSIDALVNSGIRPGVDSAVAAAALSKSLVAQYQAQKTYAQTQVQLSNLTSLPPVQIVPDTLGANRLITDGVAYTFSSPIDTAHHPDVLLFSSIYDYNNAQWKLVKSQYNPTIHFNADAWARGSSLNNSDEYNSLSQGFTTSRFNYLAGLTFSYDIFSLVHRHLYSNVNRFETEAAYHQLLNEKENLNSAVQQAAIEKDFQVTQLAETKRQLQAANAAYGQQLSLYKNGLSSIIDLNTALNYYIEAETAYLDAKIGLMRSVLNYSLVTNTFTGLVQTLNL